MFLKQKRCGRNKGRGCADGQKQRVYKTREVIDATKEHPKFMKYLEFSLSRHVSCTEPQEWCVEEHAQSHLNTWTDTLEHDPKQEG
jgi:hypothetical protein